MWGKIPTYSISLNKYFKNLSKLHQTHRLDVSDSDGISPLHPYYSRDYRSTSQLSSAQPDALRDPCLYSPSAPEIEHACQVTSAASRLGWPQATALVIEDSRGRESLTVTCEMRAQTCAAGHLHGLGGPPLRIL